MRTLATSQEGRTLGITRPVLNVVEAGAPSQAVLRRAEAAAAVLDAPLHILLVEPRVGFSTDAAIIAFADRRLQARVEQCRRVIADVLAAPERASITVLRVSSRGRPRHIWRAVAAAAARADARLVVAPEHLRHRRLAQIPVEILLVDADAAELDDYVQR